MEEKILAEFYDIISVNKKEMFDRIACERTKHITVAIENIYQEHNASAVLRSCDCFGLQEMHVIEKNIGNIRLTIPQIIEFLFK